MMTERAYCRAASIEACNLSIVTQFSSKEIPTLTAAS